MKKQRLVGVAMLMAIAIALAVCINMQAKPKAVYAMHPDFTDPNSNQGVRISNFQRLRNMNIFGRNTDNGCGFTSMSIVLQYYNDLYGCTEFVPEAMDYMADHLNDSSITVDANRLARATALREDIKSRTPLFGGVFAPNGKHPTSYTQHKQGFESYFNSYYPDAIPTYVQVANAGSSISSSVMDLIDNDIPVILTILSYEAMDETGTQVNISDFKNGGDPHVVVVYGYRIRNGKTEYLSHSGWENNINLWFLANGNKTFEWGYCYLEVESSLYNTTDLLDNSIRIDSVKSGVTLSNNLVIPNNINGRTVTHIGDSAFVGRTGLTDVQLPNTLTAIERDAFAGCTGMTSVLLPESLTTIGEAAFNYTGLTSITIPYGVTSIGKWAFRNCANLRDVYFNANNCADLQSNSYVFYISGGNTAGMRVTFGGGVSRIPAYLFHDANHLTEATVLFGVSSIGSYAFSGCTFLSTITLPSSVTSIGAQAFAGCGSLTIDAGTHLGSPSGWNALWNPDDRPVIWNGFVTKISGGTIEVTGINYQIQGQIIIPLQLDGRTVTRIGTSAFHGQAMCDDIIIPSSVTSIGDYAFYGCISLTEIILPPGLISIGVYAFGGCIGLTDITIPTSVTDISDYMFDGCASLTDVIMHNNVTSIGESAFRGCTDLTDITLPNSLTSIGTYAFLGCSGLTDITIPGSVTNIGEWAFYGTGIWNNAPSGVVIYADQWAVGTKSVSGSLVFASDTVGIADRAFGYQIDCGGVTSVTVPDSVIHLGSEALRGCVNAVSITLGSGITSIQPSMFEGFSSLANITLGSGITDIGARAFYGCNSLASITIPYGVASIGNIAFFGCGNLTIYAEAQSEPSGWAWNWNDSNRPVVWECAFATDSNGIYVGSYTPLTTSAPYYVNDPFRAGYTFGGWWSGPNGTDIKYSSLAVVPGVTAYAFWYVPTYTPGLQFSPINSGQAYSVSKGTANAANVIIPAGYNGLPVTSIASPSTGGGFQGYTGLKSISIPNTVTSLEMLAFSGCTGLTSITIPSSVTTIDPGAFYNCTGLTTVYMQRPSSMGVTYIAPTAFDNCTALTDIYVPGSASVLSYKNSCPAYAGKIESDFMPTPGLSYTLSTIAGFSFGVSLGSATDSVIRIPSVYNGIATVSEISSNGFANSNITQVIVEEGRLLNIGSGAFSGCASLASFMIPNTVTTISPNAFAGCTSLTGIVIPNTVTIIDAGVFNGCTALTEIVIHKNMSYIGPSAFKDCSALTTVYLERPSSPGMPLSGITLLWSNSGSLSSFLNCSSLAAIYVPDAASVIAYSTNQVWSAYAGLIKFDYKSDFQATPGLSYTYSPSSGSYAVARGSATDTVIYIPAVYNGKPVTEIANNGFKNSSITQAIIEEGCLSYIRQSAFEGCASLTDIVLPKSLTFVDSGVFFNCAALTEIVIPKNVTWLMSATFSGCTALTTVYIERPSSMGITMLGPLNFNNCPALTAIYVPDVASVAAYYTAAFWSDHAGLIKLDFDSGSDFNATPGLSYTFLVSSLSYGVSRGTATNTVINIPAFYNGLPVTEIASNGFANSNITQVIIEEGFLLNIRTSAFAGCASLADIIIPDGVIQIDAGAFNGCAALTEIVIPKSVTYIGPFVFVGCPFLTTVYIERPSSLSITALGPLNFDNCPALTAIYVPDSASVTTYSAATNWSAYAGLFTC